MELSAKDIGVDNFGGEFLKALLESREETFSIIIKVGTATVKAHRDVLVAHSSYCKTLLSGRFKDSSKEEVDLSQVTDDVSAVEAVVKFLYTGKIVIDTEIVDELMKLSSFLLIKSLSKLLEVFLGKALNGKNCIKFYQLSRQYGVKDQEHVISDFIVSRFNDCLIQSEHTLDLTVENLAELYKLNCFQFCSLPDVVYFIGRWVEKNPLTTVIECATKILKSLGKEGKNLKAHITKDALLDQLTVLKNTVHDCDRSEFLELFKDKTDEIFQTVSAEGYVILDAEEASSLVTLSKRKCGNELKPGECLYDLCLYDKIEGKWFTLNSITRQDLLSKTEINLSKERCSLLVFGNDVLLVSRTNYHIGKFNLESKEWSCWDDFPSEAPDVNDDWQEQWQNFVFGTDHDGNLYLVMVVTKWRQNLYDHCEWNEENTMKGFYFIATCYDKEKNCFNELFRTKVFKVRNLKTEKDLITGSFGSLKITKAKELILVYSPVDADNLLITYSIGKSEEPRYFSIPSKKLANEMSCIDACIVELEEKCIVVTFDEKRHCGRAGIQILLEYMSTGPKQSLKGSTSFQFLPWHFETIGDIVGNKQLVAGDKLLWILQEMKDKSDECTTGSAVGCPRSHKMICLSVQVEDKMVFQSHPPPPFMHIVAAAEIKLEDGFIKSLTPVHEHLV